MELFTKILDKISEYEIWNNILPGIAICILLKYIIGIDLLVGNGVEQFFVIYLIGLVNSRVGSLIVEPILKEIEPFADYSEFIEAEKIDTKIEKFSSINNKYRAMTSATLISFVLYMVESFQYNDNWKASLFPACVLLLLVVLFAFSYRKQTKYIKQRIDKALRR